MKSTKIKLVYRQMINHESTGNFESNVFTLSYEEFLLKSQAYNMENKFTTFTQMVKNDGRANSLHYKSGFGAVAFINSLQNKIPGLTDNAGKSIEFKTYQFELIESSISNKMAHKVAINYYTDVLNFYLNIGDYLLLSKLSEGAEETEKFLLKIQQGLSIVSFEPALVAESV